MKNTGHDSLNSCSSGKMRPSSSGENVDVNFSQICSRQLVILYCAQYILYCTTQYTIQSKLPSQSLLGFEVVHRLVLIEIIDAHRPNKTVLCTEILPFDFPRNMNLYLCTQSTLLKPYVHMWFEKCRHLNVYTSQPIFWHMAVL